MIGKTISHYRITGELGRGGMGVVYRAEDTKLDRTVAIKVMAPHSLASISDRNRFYREARASARLNHPHIAMVFEVDERVPEDEQGVPMGTEARPFIALEFVDGLSLAQRIKQGPLPLGEAARIARDLAEALAAAHEMDIVHRDIKSGNVMFSASGETKVLDFGLAKTAEATTLTVEGSTLGSADYMSPEQASGGEVDARSDLWSVGVILYEMVTGQVPFKADDHQATVDGILNQDPQPVSALREGVPGALAAIVDKCLRKDPSTRYQTAVDLEADLRALDTGDPAPARAEISAQSVVGNRAQRRQPRGYPLVVGVALASAVIGVMLGAFLFRSDAEPVSTPSLNLRLPLRSDQRPQAVEVHPDDRHVLVLTGDSADSAPQIVVIDLFSHEQREVPGTRGTVAMDVSPDGIWILFATPSVVSSVPFAGGEAVRLMETQAAMDLDWGPEGAFLITTSGGSYLVSETASEPTPLTQLASAGPATTAGSATSAARYFGPRWIPGTSLLLVDRSRGTGYVNSSDSTDIVLFDLETGGASTLVKQACCGRYVESGHLLYTVGGGLFSAGGQLIGRPFDLGRAELSGRPVAIPGGGGRTHWDVSSTGLFVRIGGDGSTVGIRTLISVDFRSGERSALPVPQEFVDWIRWSPDGTRLLIHAPTSPGSAANLLDLETGTMRSLSTSIEGLFSPAWSPDGLRSIVSAPSGQLAVNGDLFILDIAGSTEPETLAVSAEISYNYPEWSPNGSFVIARGRNQNTLTEELWRVDPAAGEARALRSDPGLDRYPRVSPDSKFIAYDKQLRGGSSVWVMTADGSERWMVDSEGQRPTWHPDGTSLFFQRANALMEISISSAAGFDAVGSPIERYRSPYDFVYDLSPDGNHAVLAVLIPERSVNSDELEVVTNWFAELSRVAPRAR